VTGVRDRRIGLRTSLCDTAVGAGYRDSRLPPKGFGQFKGLCDAVDAPAFWTVWTK
jgi:hypothetical protein